MGHGGTTTRARAAALGLYVLVGLAGVARAGDAPPTRDARLLAHASVDARFVPDPADPSRDLVSGRSRQELETEAVTWYGDLERRDPTRLRRSSTLGPQRSG